MFTAVFPFRSIPGRPAIVAAARGMTVVEVMVSLTILVLTTVGGVSGFIMLNQYASNLRNLSSAKALCQERIEQVQTMTFTPPTLVPKIPIPNTNPVQYNYPLGYLSSYDANGKFTGSGTVITIPAETVQIYVQQDGTTNTVPGTRTTTVSLSSLTDASFGATNANLRVVTFTVQVTYTYRGKSYSYSMYTLRAPD